MIRSCPCENQTLCFVEANQKTKFQEKKQGICNFVISIKLNCTRSSQIVINSELPLLRKNEINYHLKLQQIQRVHVTCYSQPCQSWVALITTDNRVMITPQT